MVIRKPLSAEDRAWLANYEAELARREVAIQKLDRTKVEIDIQARLLEVEWAKIYIENRLRLVDVLDAKRITEKQWCRMLGRGFSYTTIMRRIQVLKGLDRYLSERERVGDNGCFGLEHAAYLARPEKPEDATRSRSTRPQIAAGTLSSDPKHRFLTGYAHLELRKLLAQSVQVCVTSPPYWPARRLYDVRPDGTFPRPTPDMIGFEPTWEAYLDHVVRRDLRELKRVLHSDGVVFVVLDDTIAAPAKKYCQQSYHDARYRMKLQSQINLRSQDTTYLQRQGNWLGLPFLFAYAMMDERWYWRDLIIWDKGAQGRKESSDSRCRHNFEFVLVFTKIASGYWYDQDALRIPLSGGKPYSMMSGGVPRHNKPDVLRRDGDRDFRVASNPLGRIPDAVWHIPPDGWDGIHSAVFPEELVRRCLLLAAPPSYLPPVATVLDIYGGSGTVSAVAKQMGLKSIYIDQNAQYAAEAQQRLLGAKRDPGVANDNVAAEMRVGD
jgi:DNA modification methylase